MDNVGVLIVAVASAFGITAFVMRGMATRFFADYDSLRGRIETLETENKAALDAKATAEASEKVALEAKQKTDSENDTLRLEKSQLIARLDAKDKAQAERDEKATTERAELKQAFEDFKKQSADDLTAEVEKRVKAEEAEKLANEKLTAALEENATLKQGMVTLREEMQGQINSLKDKITTLENKTAECPICRRPAISPGSQIPARTPERIKKMKLRSMFGFVFGVLLMVLGLSLLSLSPVHAQDVTPVAVDVAPAPEATTQVVTGETTINIAQQPAAPVVAPSDSVTIPSWMLANLAVLLIAASAAVTIATSVIQHRSFSQALEHISVANQNAVEAAYEATPDSVKDVVQKGFDIGERLATEALAVLKFLRRVTDGLPNTTIIPDKIDSTGAVTPADDDPVQPPVPLTQPPSI